MPDKKLFFTISAELKNVIGKELITNDDVAIFELVKNSFDAHAKRVDIHFLKDRLVISDDGKGMALSELSSRWLRVAYSAKKDGTEDANAPRDYRSSLGSVSAFAGAKGIGRFSCDRLGSGLTLTTKLKSSTSKVERIVVDWLLFEGDASKDFVKVPVQYVRAKELGYGLKHGTVLEITGLRVQWNREKILHMKRSLERLINPRDNRSFKIFINAPSELQQDQKEKKKAEGKEKIASQRNIVNGQIGNFIFDRLQLKTTHVTTEVDESGAWVTTTLSDREEPIYKIREPNRYAHLKGISFKLFYLNRAAKHNFKLMTGVNAVSFGSIFVYRKGFRVQPYGDEGRDDFGIDRRKQQSVYRYLGTRDIVGSVDISPKSPGFEETSSRDGGLLNTAAWLEAVECFKEKCFKRLETYVVGVQWPDKMDSRQDDTKRLDSDAGRKRIIEVVSQLVSSDEVEVLEYSGNFIDIFNEKSEEFGHSLAALRSVAQKIGSASLLSRIDKAEKRVQEFRAAEQAARRETEKEREAREHAEDRARQAEHREKETAAENIFLRSVGSQDLDHIVTLMHQIGISASSVENAVVMLMRRLRRSGRVERKDVEEFAEIADFATKRVLTISRFATKANFRADSDDLKGNIASYLVQYINEVSRVIHDEFAIEIENKVSAGVVLKFKPIELSMLIDNVLSNTRKAKARKLVVKLSQPDSRAIKIVFQDDGKGLLEGADFGRVFDKGYTTTDGSGLGLFHVKQIVDSLGGIITAEAANPRGFVINIEVPV